jgi:hypothetical protein
VVVLNCAHRLAISRAAGFPIFHAWQSAWTRRATTTATPRRRRSAASKSICSSISVTNLRRPAALNLERQFRSQPELRALRHPSGTTKGARTVLRAPYNWMDACTRRPRQSQYDAVSHTDHRRPIIGLWRSVRADPHLQMRAFPDGTASDTRRAYRLGCAAYGSR